MNTAKSQQKRKAKGTADDSGGKRAGNPGNFHGARLAFLEEQLPIYMSKKGRGEVTDFFAKVLGLWLKQFPWYEGYGPDGKPLPKGWEGSSRTTTDASGAASSTNTATASSTTDVSSTTDAPMTDAAATASSGTTDAPMTKASTDVGTNDWTATGGVDPALRDKIKGEVIAQVKGWFSHKKTAAHRANKNPFVDWLEGFERPGQAPRKLPLHKFYMQHDDFADGVEELFNEKWPSAGLEGRFALDFCCKCAQELLAKEPEQTRQKLEEERDVDHEEMFTRHQGRWEKVGNPDELAMEKREACRTNLAQVVQPFLDGVAKLTGLHVTFLAGAAPPVGSEKFILTSLTSFKAALGAHRGHRGLTWDREGFKRNVMGQWVRFLAETAEHGMLRGERHQRLLQLGNMHIDAFNRENNIARNMALMDELKLRQATSQILRPATPPPPPPPPPARPRARPAWKGATRRQSSRLAATSGERRSEADDDEDQRGDDRDAGDDDDQREDDRDGGEGEHDGQHGEQVRVQGEKAAGEGEEEKDDECDVHGLRGTPTSPLQLRVKRACEPRKQDLTGSPGIPGNLELKALSGIPEVSLEFVHPATYLLSPCPK
ncbi:hypothetical protein C8R47DRAFT_1064586 [Mycena vitilis]|nr:hypothetical protein C8R47DRAFT_1064586 [Mycena vitilis]